MLLYVRTYYNWWQGSLLGVSISDESHKWLFKRILRFRWNVLEEYWSPRTGTLFILYTTNSQSSHFYLHINYKWTSIMHLVILWVRRLFGRPPANLFIFHYIWRNVHDLISQASLWAVAVWPWIQDIILRPGTNPWHRKKTRINSGTTFVMSIKFYINSFSTKKKRLYR